jgi:hypothetical protein
VRVESPRNDPDARIQKTTWGAVLIWLIIASGISGLLFGRFFRVYALVPAILLLIGPAYYLGHEQGLGTGVLAFALSAATMQLCYFISLVTYLLIANLAVKEAPSEAFL